MKTLHIRCFAISYQIWPCLQYCSDILSYSTCIKSCSNDKNSIIRNVLPHLKSFEQMKKTQRLDCIHNKVVKVLHAYAQASEGASEHEQHILTSNKNLASLAARAGPSPLGPSPPPRPPPPPPEVKAFTPFY